MQVCGFILSLTRSHTNTSAFVSLSVTVLSAHPGRLRFKTLSSPRADASFSKRPAPRSRPHDPRDCLRRQGGLDACNLAFYQEHDLGNDGEWDNWRIEGPAFVSYFRGFPHAHVSIHVAEAPGTPVTSHFG